MSYKAHINLVQAYYKKIENLFGFYCCYPYLVEGFKFYNDIHKHFRVIGKLCKITSNLKILEAGCGFGEALNYLNKLYKNNTYSGITLSEYQFNNKRFNNIKLGNFDKTEFKNDEFDLIIFLESFSHSFNKGLTLREAYRLLKPGGKLFILDLCVDKATHLSFISKNKINYKSHYNFYGNKPVCKEYILKKAKQTKLKLVSFREKLTNNTLKLKNKEIKQIVKKIIIPPNDISTFYNYFLFIK